MLQQIVFIDTKQNVQNVNIFITEYVQYEELIPFDALMLLFYK